MVGGDLLDGQVAVVVDDGQVARRAVVELARDVGLEQEVVVDERLHARTSASPRSGGSSDGTSRWMIASAAR